MFTVSHFACISELSHALPLPMQPIFELIIFYPKRNKNQHIDQKQHRVRNKHKSYRSPLRIQYNELRNDHCKKYDKQRNHPSFKYSLHHIQSGAVITEDSLIPAHPICRPPKIAVSHIIHQILPSAVPKHLHIFFFMCNSLLVIVQLIDHFLRNTSFKMIDYRKRYSGKTPALCVHPPEIFLLLLIIHN